MPDAPSLAAIHWGSIGTLLLVSAALMGSPGPVTVSLVAAGSTGGIGRSLLYLLGTVAGSEVVLVAVATGVTAALLAVPALGAVLVWASVAYILWLAYHIATAPPLSAAGPAATAFSFAGGAVLGVANPKAWVAMAAVFASSRLADAAAADAAAKVVVLTGMSVAILTTWLLVGTSMAPLLRDPRRARVVNAVLAVTVVAATALAVLH
ncbi:MAG TPA: LysE family transporter [Candidatus Eisenbacteria bacterium]|nr:LysE family transporter [Candidatus Eisenbacteria bacterium]